jgi:ubiquinone/menaquinone biosynthesis C-methylase UbiE
MNYGNQVGQHQGHWKSNSICSTEICVESQSVCLLVTVFSLSWRSYKTESGSKQVKTYFNRVPKEWDSLYSHENKLGYAINKWLRKGLFERYRLTFENCGDIAGAKVLDIGCGTGRFSIECARRGAKRVVGIDFAPSMVEFSRHVANRMGLSDKCEFIIGDFLTHRFNESFDIVLALGFFDYIKEPGPVFKKIGQLSPRRFLASLPKFTYIWSIQRHIRYYWIKKCPIYYYTMEQIKGLCKESGFSNFKIVQSKRGFFCVSGCD